MRSAGLMHKLKNWVSGDSYEDELFLDEEEFESPSASDHASLEPASDLRSHKFQKSHNLKVVEHPKASANAHVMVAEPRAFEEVLEMVEHLRNRKAVILNLQCLDTAQSQRVVDFLSGATHAIDGNQHRIGDTVFVFTPHNVSIQNSMHSFGDSKGLWTATH